MNSQLIERLTKVRENLYAEAVWGVGDVEVVGEVPPTLTHKDGAAGEGGAQNISDSNDAFFQYVDSIVKTLTNDHDMDEDEALDLVFGTAKDMADRDELPALPEDDKADKELAAWLGKAKSAGFHNEVLMAAKQGDE